MATVVSYSFVHFQISLTNLFLKYKIQKKNTLSQARLVRLILIQTKEY